MGIMASNYGDIPCVNLSGEIHITISATRCLCGNEWKYGVTNRAGKSNNIIWRDLDAVNCEKCKEIYIKENI